MLAVAAVFVGILFVYSGTAKLLSIRSFSQSLLLIPYLPYRLARPVAWVLPRVEILAGILMMFGSFWGKLPVIGLLLVFSWVAWLTHRLKLTVPCNCFGAENSGYLTLGTAVRSGILAAVTGCSILVPGQYHSMVTETFGALAFVLFLAVGQAVRNHREFIRSFEERRS